MFIKQIKFLSILAKNSKITNSCMISSDRIADELHLSSKQTRELAKYLHAHGVIESDMDGQLSIITRKGIQWLEKFIF